MRAEAGQNQQVVADFAIDEQQVGLDMAFAITNPVAGEIVVTVTRFKRLVSYQGFEYG